LRPPSTWPSALTTLAIMASSLNVDDNGVLKTSADNRLFVIDLTTTRP
jgi:hypothetical protein